MRAAVGDPDGGDPVGVDPAGGEPLPPAGGGPLPPAGVGGGGLPRTFDGAKTATTRTS